MLVRIIGVLGALAVMLPSVGARALQPALCHAEEYLHSIEGVTRIGVTIRNERSRGNLKVFWLDYDGVRNSMGGVVIPPKGERRIRSYATHPFVITDHSENCLSVFVAEGAREHVVTIKR